MAIKRRSFLKGGMALGPGDDLTDELAHQYLSV